MGNAEVLCPSAGVQGVSPCSLIKWGVGMKRNYEWMSEKEEAAQKIYPYRK